MTADRLVFLVDVDNTLLDNDRIQDDLKRHLAREVGAECRDRYWAMLEALFVELGIATISARYSATGLSILGTSS